MTLCNALEHGCIYLYNFNPYTDVCYQTYYNQIFKFNKLDYYTGIHHYNEFLH